MSHAKNKWHEVKGITRGEMRLAEEKTLKKYGDILDAVRPMPPRPKASPKQRAAQFLPFSALSGFEKEIEQEGKITEKRRELSEAEKEEINAALEEIRRTISIHPVIEFQCYEEEKDGTGRLRKDSGRVKKLDVQGRQLILTDGRRIAFADLAGLSAVSMEEGEA